MPTSTRTHRRVDPLIVVCPDEIIPGRSSGITRPLRRGRTPRDRFVPCSASFFGFLRSAYRAYPFFRERVIRRSPSSVRYRKSSSPIFSAARAALSLSAFSPVRSPVDQLCLFALIFRSTAIFPRYASRRSSTFPILFGTSIRTRRVEEEAQAHAGRLFDGGRRTRRETGRRSRPDARGRTRRSCSETPFPVPFALRGALQHARDKVLDLLSASVPQRFDPASTNRHCAQDGGRVQERPRRVNRA